MEQTIPPTSLSTPLPVHSLRIWSSVWASQWFLRDLELLASGRGASAATSTESGFGLGGEVDPLLGPPGTYRPFGDDPRNVFDLGGHQSHFQLPWEIPGPLKGERSLGNWSRLHNWAWQRDGWGKIEENTEAYSPGSGMPGGAP